MFRFLSLSSKSNRLNNLYSCISSRKSRASLSPFLSSDPLKNSINQSISPAIAIRPFPFSSSTKYLNIENLIQNPGDCSPKPAVHDNPVQTAARNRSKFSPTSYLKCTAFGNSIQNGNKFSWFSCSIGESRNFCSETVRESLQYDVVIVGAGPSGLSAAIRLKQMCQEKNVDLSVCVVEKGAEVGAHIISGNVFEPRALDELLPNWREEGAPIEVPVSSDKFWLLTKDRAFSLPSPFDNRGNYVISLSQFVRWMGMKAEELGVEIYPGFSASEILYDANHKVVGIGTNDMGVAKDGSKRATFQRGVELKGMNS